MKVFFGFEEFPIIYSHKKLGKIKVLLEQGKMTEVNRLLGSPYRIKGKMGHQIRLTAQNNQFLSSLTIDLDSTLLPGAGVYEVFIRHKDSDYSGKVNIGVEQDCKQIAFLINNFNESMIEQELEITFKDANRADIDPDFREDQLQITTNHS